MVTSGMLGMRDAFKRVVRQFTNPRDWSPLAAPLADSAESSPLSSERVAAAANAS